MENGNIQMKTLILSKPEIKRLRQALYQAIRYEEDYIDAHKINYPRGKNSYLKEKTVPKEFKLYVSRSKRSIDSWIKLLEKLKA